MKNKILICFILCACGAVLCEDEDSDSTEEAKPPVLGDIIKLEPRNKTKECWMKVNAPSLFAGIDAIDSKYAATRKEVKSYLEKNSFDKDMIEAMLQFRGAAQREIIKSRSDHGKIPAGLNLGGRCMIRLPDSVLFFHRMKLRNNTLFRINVLHNDIENMVLRMHIALNDLHMKGAYERTMTDRDPAALIYSPSFGELELLLKDVQFSMEGRYRLIKSRLVVEVIISELLPHDIILTHVNLSNSDSPMRIRKDNLGDFTERLKTDLNKWLQDYLNDYLIYYSLDKVPSIGQLQKYDKEKAAFLARFMDNSINIISKRIRSIGGSSIRVPQFSIVAAHGLKVKIYDGLLQGLDTMYRRSVVTTLAKRPDFRFVNSIIGFSNLKVVYRYEISFPAGSPSPALTGVIILTANDLMGHLTLGLIKEPEVMEIDIDFINQIGPNSLTVEGAANLMISNFKHLLQHQILTIMSNTVIYGVEMLRSLPRCEPFVPGQLRIKPAPKINKIRNMDEVNSYILPIKDTKTNAIESEDELLRRFSELRRKYPQVPLPTANIATSSIRPF